jgi:hypothetical protein
MHFRCFGTIDRQAQITAASLGTKEKLLIFAVGGIKESISGQRGG